MAIHEELFSTAAAAAYLGMSEIGVKKSKKIEGFLINARSRIYLKRELDAYKAKRDYDPTEPYDKYQPELGGYEDYIRSQIFETDKAAEYLGIAVQTLKTAKKEKRIEGVLIHNRLLIYLKDELDDYKHPKQGRPETPNSKWHGFHEKYKGQKEEE